MDNLLSLTASVLSASLRSLSVAFHAVKLCQVTGRAGGTRAGRHHGGGSTFSSNDVTTLQIYTKI